MGLFGDQFPQKALAAAEVPQLPMQTSHSCAPYRSSKQNVPPKKPRLEFLDDDDDDDYFTVPDLG